MDNPDIIKLDEEVPGAEGVFQMLIALLEEQEQVKIDYELLINKYAGT